jgi:microcystin-dependent protein
MPLESPLQYVNDLNPANPTAPDGLNQGDDHIRGMKLALKQTFPNFTSGALTASQADLDGAVSATTNGVSVLADAGAHFKTNTNDGFTNPANGEVDVKAGSSLFKHKSDGSFEAPGTIKADGGFIGVGVVPIGMPCVWFEDTLPDASYGDYAWLNGQVIASANTRCPTLLARWTNRFGGNGTTTMGVPNMCEVAPYGKSTMGGATSPGRITNYALTTIGAFIGACLHALTAGELAPHTHGFAGTTGDDFPDHTHGIWTQSGNSFAAPNFPAPSNSSLGTQSTGASNRHVHNFSGNTDTGAGVAGSSHDNVSPGIVVNWVVRLA